MEFLKELFGEGELSYEKFAEAVTSKGYKLADLSTGNYVSKAKYDDDVQRRDTTISDLNTQISTRDTDLANLQSQLSNVDADNKTKVATLTTQLESLQSEYANVKNEYDSKLQKQSYEFAVRDFANSQKFTSNAAKRDFINEMLSENLKMKDNVILGADDFVKAYSANNADAFLVDAPEDKDEKPIIIKPTEPAPKPEENAFANAFHFASLHGSK